MLTCLVIFCKCNIISIINNDTINLILNPQIRFCLIFRCLGFVNAPKNQSPFKPCQTPKATFCKFPKPLVRFLQRLRSVAPTAPENFSNYAVAMLRGCWRKFTEVPVKSCLGCGEGGFGCLLSVWKQKTGCHFWLPSCSVGSLC